MIIVIIITGCSGTVDNLLIDRKVTLDYQGRQRIQIWQQIDLNLSVFRENNTEIVLDNQCHRKLQRTFTDREEP